MQEAAVSKEKKETPQVIQEAVFSLRLSDGRYVVLQNKTDAGQAILSPITYSSATVGLTREFLGQVQDYIDSKIIPLVQEVDSSIIGSDVFCEYQDTVPNLSVSPQQDNQPVKLDRIFWVKIQPKVEKALLQVINKGDTDFRIISNKAAQDIQAGTLPNTDSAQKLDERCALMSQELKNPMIGPELQEHILKNKEIVKKILRSLILLVESIDRKIDKSGSKHQLQLQDIDRLRKLVSNKEMMDKLEWTYLRTRLAVIVGQQLAGAVAEGMVTYSNSQKQSVDTILSMLGVAGFITTTLYGNKQRETYDDTIFSSLTDALNEVATQYEAEQRSLALPDIVSMAQELPRELGKTSQYLSRVWEVLPSMLSNCSALVVQGKDDKALLYAGVMAAGSALWNTVSGSEYRNNLRKKWNKVTEKLRQAAFVLMNFTELGISQFIPYANEILIPLSAYAALHLIPGGTSAEDRAEAATGLEELRELITTLEIGQATLATEEQFKQFARGIVAQYKNSSVDVTELVAQILPAMSGEALQVDRSPELVALFDSREINHQGSVEPSEPKGFGHREFHEEVSIQPESKILTRFQRFRNSLRNRFIGKNATVERDTAKKPVRYRFLDKIFGATDDLPEAQAQRVDNIPIGMVVVDLTVATQTQVFLEEANLVLERGKVCEINEGSSFILRTLAEKIAHPNGTTFIRLSNRDVNIHEESNRSYIGYYECDKVSTLKRDYFPEFPDDTKVQNIMETTQLFTADEIKEYLSRRRAKKPLDMGRSFRSRLQLAVAGMTEEPVVFLDKPIRMVEDADEVHRVSAYIAQLCKNKIVVITEDRGKLKPSQLGYREQLAEAGVLDSRKFNKKTQKIERDSFTVLHLKQVFKQYHIDYSNWGEGDAKTLQELVDEIARGQSRLVEEQGELKRTVSVSKLEVSAKSSSGKPQELVEVKQVLPPATGGSENRERYRKEPDGSELKGVSVRILPGEDPRAAALRALQKEVPELAHGVTLQDIEIVRTAETREEVSKSYPNITSKYETHFFRVNIKKRQRVSQAFTYSQLTGPNPKIAHYAWRSLKGS